ncbi:hypothetical protein [Pseudomonas sp. FH1]|uniref:hypothetical protein n=1 Tax=Pseudomonas sp. FH1 TaxID=1284392 RepID=UPI001F4D1BA5|nr:hypothetical protein [Pseudomonas sp. FH1]
MSFLTWANRRICFNEYYRRLYYAMDSPYSWTAACEGSRHQGEKLDMQDKLSINVRPLFFNILLWVFGVTLLLISKGVIERMTGSTDEGSLDLPLVLIAYLLLFLLTPIRAWTHRRLRKRARRLSAGHRPKPGH